VRILIIIIIGTFFCTPIFGQIKLDPELQEQLKGKTNFQEIKKITLNYYRNQASKKSTNQNQKNAVKQLKHLNRRFWIDEFYVGADGRVANRAQTDLKAIKSLAANKKSVGQDTPWVLEGPVDMSASDITIGDGIGRFDHIAFHPTNSNIMWAGSPLGGLFKTTNGGASWFPLSSYLPSLGVAGIAINATNPNIIYVLSGDSNSDGIYFSETNYGQNNNGVFKSTDGGLTWSYSGLNGLQGRDLLINPIDPDILFAATGSGVYRSTNGGASWSNRGYWIDIINLTQASLGDVRDIEFKPGDYNTIYAVTNDKFYKSNTNGDIFEEKIIQDLSGEGGGRIVIGTTPDNPSRVYIFSGPGIDLDADGDPDDGFKGFFSSEDSGESFIRITQEPGLFSSTQGTDVASTQWGYNIAITVNPLDENEIFVGGVVVWHSTDGGINWEQISSYWDNIFLPSYMHPDIHDLKYNPLNNKLFCANDGGIYSRILVNPADPNLGYRWLAHFNGLSAATFYQFEIEDDNGNLWGGAQDNGIMIQDNGTTFFNYNGGDGFDVMTDHPYDVDNGESDDVYYSVNQWICADRLGNNCTRGVDINVDMYKEFFGKLAMSPEDEADIYAGYSHGLYFSSNRGTSWTEISEGRPADWCLSTCRSNPNVVYIAGDNINWAGNLYKRDNGIWSDLTGNLNAQGYSTYLKITDIDVSRSDHNSMFISVGGTKPDSKVFFTSNGGASFSNLSYDLPNVPIFCVKTDELSGIYVGTSIGVYYLPFGSTNWQPFYNGLPNVAVTEIELASNDPDNLGIPPFTKVYASTFGRGIWSANAFSNCLNFLTKTGNAQGQEFYEAGTELTSTQVLSGGQYTQLKLNSGNRIKLLPGFHAPTGSYMKTYLEGCGGNVSGN